MAKKSAPAQTPPETKTEPTQPSQQASTESKTEPTKPADAVESKEESAKSDSPAEPKEFIPAKFHKFAKGKI